ncbi:MAG: glycerophosphodiester phosphodiesterase family protein [Planctomycetota bacterium]|nr:glycerophosphodiester phosphodiesterase family protein [Planctomycetota bacterium]
MKAVFARVELFDPVTEETFPVHEHIEVLIARLDAETRRVDLDRLPLTWDDATRCFTAPASDYKTSRKHFFVVTFEKRNFDKRTGTLLSYDEGAAVEDVLWAPARVPSWDSGWDDNYKRNEFFGWRGRQDDSSPQDPIVLRVPIRRLYVVGHRGAPHAYPENTLAAFRAALDMGANALELDTCLMKDGGIAVFHDNMPVKQPPRIDRTKFEKLPYELVSPTFNLTGGTATLHEVQGDRVVEVGERDLDDRRELDMVRLTFEEAKDVYRFPPVEGQEHRLIDLDTFLAFARDESDRLRMLFFDIKPPGKLSDVKPAEEYGRRLGEALRRYPTLPERLVVGYADTKVLRKLKQGIAASGEARPWFAYDAAGGLAPWLIGAARGWWWLPGFLRRFLGWMLGGVANPLRTARRMRNRVVSIGKLARPAHLDEIRQGVRDRDYRPKSTVELVVHWTLNDREDFAHSIESGVNAVLTDKPDDLVDYLKSLGLRVC